MTKMDMRWHKNLTSLLNWLSDKLTSLLKIAPQKSPVPDDSNNEFYEIFKEIIPISLFLILQKTEELDTKEKKPGAKKAGAWWQGQEG